MLVGKFAIFTPNAVILGETFASAAPPLHPLVLSVMADDSRPEVELAFQETSVWKNVTLIDSQ